MNSEKFMPKKTKSNPKKTPPLDAADQLGLAMLAPARAVAEHIGVAEFTMRLCAKLGKTPTPNHVQQVRRWLETDTSKWQHPRAGVVKAMLEIK